MPAEPEPPESERPELEGTDPPVEIAAVSPAAVDEARPLDGPFGYGEASAVAGPPVSGRRATTLLELRVRADGVATEIVLRADGELAFEVFRLERPERLVLDLEDVVDRTRVGRRVVGRSFVISVSVEARDVQSGARMVLDLIRRVEPVITRSGDRLVVRVEP